MKPNNERLNPQFVKEMDNLGYPLDDIFREINTLVGDDYPLNIIEGWTGRRFKYNPPMQQRVLYDELRDEVAPQIHDALDKLLEPWIRSGCDSDLFPSIEIVYVSRKAGVSVSQAVNALTSYPYRFTVRGLPYQSWLEKPRISDNERLSLASARRYGLNPKQIARDARYQSRPPGGGPVQKAGLKEKDISNKIKHEAGAKRQITFITSPDKEEKPFRLLKYQRKKPCPTKPPVKKAELTKPKKELSAEVFDWFKSIGYRKTWVYEKKEDLFRQALEQLTQGKRVEFLIWNCIGFNWFPNQSGGLPLADVYINRDTSITKYFNQRIIDSIEMLCFLGDPSVTILIPSSEALDASGIWQYTKPQEERETIINDAVKDLEAYFSQISFPQNADVRVMRWDQYILEKGLKESADEFSKKGVSMLRGSHDAYNVVETAISSAEAYFSSRGFSYIGRRALEQSESLYYGMYAGEGLALSQLLDADTSVVLLNFEEMRIAKMTFLGAGQRIPIVTPITPEEMTKYYQWKKIQEQK